MKQPVPTIILMAEAAGGVTRHLLDMYGGLKAFYRVKMILSPYRIDERYQAELALCDQADIFYVPMQRNPSPSDLGALRQIRRILRDIPGPKILHAHSTKAGLMGSLLRGLVDATVFTPHAYRGLDPDLSDLARFGLELVEKSYSARYDRVVVLAPAEMEYALSIGIRPDLLELIPNGIPLAHVDWQKRIASRLELRRDPVLGFVGRLAYQKNPELFVEVLAGLVRQGHNVSAILVGDGPLQAELEILAKQRGVFERISWKGGARASDYFPLMDINVHTSRYEGLPYSILETCANLLPIVATSNPGSEAILRARLPGQLYGLTDVEGIISNVHRLLTDQAFRLEQIEALRRTALEYSAETMIDRHSTLYQSLVGSCESLPQA